LGDEGAVHRSEIFPLMSARGQSRSFGDVGSMSGLPESGHRQTVPKVQFR